MITGEDAYTNYIDTNLKKCGMEVWRRMNKNNDPKTFTTVDGHLRIINDLAKTRCKTMKELRERLESTKMAHHKYIQAGGEELSNVTKRHNLVNILPDMLIQQLQVQDGFGDWTYEDIMNKVEKIMTAQTQYNIDNA